LSSSCGWLTDDAVVGVGDDPAEAFEVVKVLLCAALRAVASQEVVTAEVLVGLAAGEDVEDHDQDRVPYRLAGAGLAAAFD
jgi:hypothetical protein